MSKLTDQIREYVSCPQLGDKHYGKWGILPLEQRQNIAQLCEYCNLQEKYAETFFKETQSLKRQLAEKDEELAELKDRLEYITENRNGVVQVFDITDHDKEIRHQVCEEIRNYIHTNEYDQFGIEYLMNGGSILDELDQIEQGESK